MKSTSPRLANAAAPALTGCPQYASMSGIKPPPRGEAGISAGDPLAALDAHTSAAGNAWRRIDSNPGDVEARRNDNFAIARICGTLREAGLKPWRSLLRLASHTLEWKY